MNIFERNAKKVAIAAVFAASFSAIFVRLTDAPPLAIGFYRLAFTMPFFIVAVLGWHQKELRSISAKDLGGSLLAGLFLAAHFLSWFTALEYTTVASATVICLTHPIVILIITTLILKEKTNGKAVTGVLVAFLGGAIISGGDYSFSAEALFGDLMAFLGAVFIALYFLTGRRFRKNVNATVYIFLVFGSCWMAFTIGMIGTGTPFTGYRFMDFIWILVMAVVCQVGAHALFNWCLAYMKPLFLATWETGEAIIAASLAALIFSEIPTLWQLIGGGLTICGLLYYNYHDIDKQEEIIHDISGIG